MIQDDLRATENVKLVLSNFSISAFEQSKLNCSPIRAYIGIYIAVVYSPDVVGLYLLQLLLLTVEELILARPIRTL